MEPVAAALADLSAIAAAGMGYCRDAHMLAGAWQRPANNAPPDKTRACTQLRTMTSALLSPTSRR